MATKKCTAVVCYHATGLYSLTIITRKGEHINLETYGRNFESFNAMYDYVLTRIKLNGFMPTYYKGFSRIWYDILWYDALHPTKHQKFGYIPSTGVK